MATKRSDPRLETRSQSSGESNSETSSLAAAPDDDGVYESKGETATPTVPAHKTAAFAQWVAPRGKKAARDKPAVEPDRFGASSSTDNQASSSSSSSSSSVETGSTASGSSSGSLQLPGTVLRRSASASGLAARPAEPVAADSFQHDWRTSTDPQSRVSQFGLWYRLPESRAVIRDALNAGYVDELVRFFERTNRYLNAQPGERLAVLKEIYRQHFADGAEDAITVHGDELAHFTAALASATAHSDTSFDGDLYRAFRAVRNNIAELAHDRLKGTVRTELEVIVEKHNAAQAAAAARAKSLRGRFDTLTQSFTAKPKPPSAA
ncbi:MAG: hypothetical protein V4669_15225 [Pseudomonadota bacterium]